MADTLRIAVCETILDEVSAVLAGQPDVEIVPHACSSACRGCLSSTTLCLGLMDPGSAGVPGAAVTNCFSLLAPPRLVQEWIDKGCYLVTPGWLARWEQIISGWGFGRQSARQFLRESARSVLLLDTGIDGEGVHRCQAFADYIGISFDTVPVGLDGIQRFLAGLVGGWRHARALQEKDLALEEARQRIADAATAFDLLERVSRITTEEEVIAGIVEVFTMLFAPEGVAYAAVDRGIPRMVAISPGAPGEAELDEVLRFLDDPAETAVPDRTGAGFLVGVARAEELLGIVHVRQLAFPRHIRRYLELARTISGVCGLAVDNARAYARIRQLNADRVRAVRLESLGILAGGMAHDFNNLLTIVIGHADLLSRNSSSEDVTTGAEAILSSARRAARIVERLMAAAAVQQVRLEEADLNLFIGHASGMLRAILGDQIEIHFDLAGGPIRVRLDTEQMSTVVVNIATNAREAMKDGGIFTVRTAATETGALLSFTDTGRGMDEAVREKLFAPYFTTQQFGRSAGWGLAVALGIVRRHGGEIDVASTPGMGSTFTLKLPLAPR